MYECKQFNSKELFPSISGTAAGLPCPFYYEPRAWLFFLYLERDDLNVCLDVEFGVHIWDLSFSKLLLKWFLS